MQAGIVGLPNVGKTTLFNALTFHEGEVGPYPFTTIEPNIAEVFIPDERLVKLKDLLTPRESRLARLKFLDIAGLVKGAHKGAGLGNQFLSHIRNVDVIVHVVRCYSDGDIAHVEGSLDPVRDVEIVELELMLSDIALLEKSFDKLKKSLKLGHKEDAEEAAVLEKMLFHLDKGEPLRRCEDISQSYIKKYSLLSVKPTLFVLNISEKEESTSQEETLRILEFLKGRGDEWVISPAKLETELSVLSQNEINEYLNSIGLSSRTLDNLVKKTFSLLNCVIFYTTASDILQNWIIKKGATLREAASTIHSVMDEGFIKAEVVRYEDLVRMGSVQKVKESGLMRFEGKDSLIEDGDIVYIRFRG